MIFMSFGLYKLLEKEKIKNIMYVLCTLTIVFNLFSLGKYGIKNTTYYNVLAGRNNLAAIYELDYYNVTGKDAINKFLKLELVESNQDGLVYLYGNGFNERIIEDILTFSNSNLKNKIKQIKESELESVLKEKK